MSRKTPELRYTTTTLKEYTFNPEAVFWFLQISDTHFSHTQSEIYSDFDLFLKRRVNSGIAPEFVVLSGDIVDGFERGQYQYPFFVSKQYIEQWIQYRSILSDNNLWDPSVWIDLRGNHDCYSVPSVHHPLNYFSQYSTVSRRWGPSQFEYAYSFVYTTDYGTYSLVLFDACPEVGVNFPLNFFGTSHEASEVALKEEMEQAVNHNVSFFVSHYPLNDMRTSAVFRDLASVNVQGEKKLVTYVALSGHLHALDTYRRVDDALIELELADFKDHRFYRIISVDNDLFSFKDVIFQKDDFPLVHITLPKKSSVLSSREEWRNMRIVRHIRALVFSELPVDGSNLRVYIDDELVASSMERVVLENRRFNYTTENGGLYSAEYDPSRYSSGTHTLRVELMNGNDVSASDRIEFTLDGTTTTFGTWEGYVRLNMKDYEVARTIVAFFYAYTVLILLLLPKLLIWGISVVGLYPQFRAYMYRYLAHASEIIPNAVQPLGAENSSKRRPNVAMGFLYICSDLVHSVGFHIMQYGRIPFFLWFIHMLFAVYFIVGPIIVGPVVDEIQGFLFFPGVLVNNVFSEIPETVAYYGFIILVLMWMPSITVSSIPYNTRVECDKILKKLGYFEGEGFFRHLLRAIYRFTLLGFLAAACSLVCSLGMTLFLAWQYGYGVLSSIMSFWFVFLTAINTALAMYRVWRIHPSKVIQILDIKK